MQKIECPCCKRQYSIQEIFMPDYLLGKAQNIVRNEEGEIEVYDGVEQDTTEEYTCDLCGTTFKVNATLTFETEKVESLSDDEYSTPIFKDRIILKEE